MNIKEYVDSVLVTESCDWPTIHSRMADAARLIHGVAGLVTETGELQDQLKKYIFYGRTLDVVNIKEELGDLLWYFALICDEISDNGESGGGVFTEIMEKNIAKLKARYAGKFTHREAENRNLDAERKTLEGA